MAIIQFKPYVKVFKKDHFISFNNPLYQSRRRTFELNFTGILVCQLVSEKCSLEQFKHELKANNCLTEGLEILSNLEKWGYVDIKSEQSHNHEKMYEIYNRVLPMLEMFKVEESPSEVQTKLFGKKVAIIGCGTVGINIAVKLTLIGVSRYILIDGDKVEQSNLTRCPFLIRQDVGKPKVDVLKRLIEERLDHTLTKPNIESYKASINNSLELENVLTKDIDVLIVAADDDKIMEAVEQYSNEHNVPLVYPGGYYGFDATIFPMYLKGKNQSPTDINKVLNQYKEESGENMNLLDGDVVASSIVQTADAISNILSFEILRYFVEGWTVHLERGPLMYNLANNVLVDINEPTPETV